MKTFYLLSKKYKQSRIFFILSLTLVMTSCQNFKSVNLESEINLIRQTDKNWVNVFVSKDISRILEFYDDSAILINTDGKAYRGIDEIRKIWIEILETPGYSCNWHTADVIVAKSGDLGYTIGPWEVSLINKSGEQKTYYGTNVIVWKKQPNGTWKVIVDKT